MTPAQWKYVNISYPVWQNTSEGFLALVLEESLFLTREVLVGPGVAVQCDRDEGTLLLIQETGDLTSYLITDFDENAFAHFVEVLDNESGFVRQTLEVIN